SSGAMVFLWGEVAGGLACGRRGVGSVPRDRERGGWVVLGAPGGNGQSLSFRGRDRRANRRNWVHLDLYTNDQPREVERLISLGAGRYPWRYPPRADYVVLEDPDGNLFCVVQKST